MALPQVIVNMRFMESGQGGQGICRLPIHIHFYYYLLDYRRNPATALTTLTTFCK
jgi:hypothetical protein